MATSKPDTTEPLPRYITLREVCDILGVSDRWLRDEIKAGHVPARMFAGAYRFKVSEIEDWADGCAVTPQRPEPT